MRFDQRLGQRCWLFATIIVVLAAPLSRANSAEAGKGARSGATTLAIQSSDSPLAPQFNYGRRAVGDGVLQYAMPANLKAQGKKCARSGRAFDAIADRRWSAGDGAAMIRRGIDKLVTRDFDKSETLAKTMSVIFLEGATSSQHWHDVTVLGDTTINGQHLRIVAIWSLAYGKGAFRTERALSFVEYLRDGNQWRPVTLGIGLEIYLGSQTEIAKLVWIDRETYAVEVRVKDEGLPDRSEFFVPAWGCFWRLSAGDRSQLAEGVAVWLKGAAPPGRTP